jgi:hypothetical protein
MVQVPSRREVPYPTLLSYLDELAAEHGHDKVKALLVQKLKEVPEVEFQQIFRDLELKDPSEYPNHKARARASNKNEMTHIKPISQVLNIVIPRTTYLRTMKKELQTMSQLESSVCIANVLVAEWEFIDQYNQRFEDAYRKWLIEMRGNVTSTSPLNKLIREALDIAPLFAKSVSGQSDGMASETFSTHPSAGLSYLQTNNYLDNHPILGPQSTRTPVDARVLSPRTSDSRGQSAHFGIGGFVVQEPAGITGSGDSDPRVAKLDPEADGGVKIPLEVPYASVDRWAAVKLQTRRPRVMDAVHIKKGALTHPVLDEYRRANRSEGFPARYQKAFDRERSVVSNLLGMLDGKKKEKNV